MALKILLVALAFPPKLDAESLQTHKLQTYLKALPETNVHVVTSRETTNVASLLSSNIGLKDGCTEFDLFASRYIDFLRLRFLPGLSSRPDIKGHAVSSWKAIARSLPWRPDVILSRSYPVTSALLAQRIADHLSVPWVMQMSDPWTLSPLHPKGYALQWNSLREEKAFAQAKMVTFTSERTLAKYASHYPRYADRFRYFPNTYDPAYATPNPWSRGPRMRLVYAGTLGGSRTPDVLCGAVEAFILRCPEAANEIEVLVAGHASRPVRRYLHSKTAYLKFLGPVGFAEAVDLLRSADVLVLIDNELPSEGSGSSYEFFPSKLLDYMLAQRTVLAITASDSISAEVIAQEDLGQSFSHANVSRISDAIEHKWRAWRADDRSAFEVSSRSDLYDAKLAAIRLRQEIEGLINGR